MRKPKRENTRHFLTYLFYNICAENQSVFRYVYKIFSLLSKSRGKTDVLSRKFRRLRHFSRKTAAAEKFHIKTAWRQ